MGSRTALVRDDEGTLVLLANVPGAGVSRADPDARGGNPRHDIRSGKFAPGARRAQDKAQRDLQNPSARQPRATRQGADPTALDAQRRRDDAVRDAARTLGRLDPGTIEGFLQDRAVDPGAVDVQAFLLDVQEARLDDIADMLHDRLAGAGGGIISGRGKVRVKGPRSWIRTAFNGLEDDDVVSVVRRLEARGHDPADILKTVMSNINSPERRERLNSTFGLDTEAAA